MEDIPFSYPGTKEEKLLKKLSLGIDSNSKNKYSISLLGYHSYLEIKINTMAQMPKLYKEKFSLDKIKKISKYFLICESISDVISSIEPNINQSKIIEEKNTFKFIISLNHPLCKEAIFIIPEKIKIFDSTELYHIITELRNNNQNQQNIINQQQEIIKNLQINVNDLMRWVKTLEEKMKIKEKEEKEKEKRLYLDLKDSNIIPNDYEKEKAIKKWINPFKKIKFELLFRKSRDGSSCKTFHKYCDNKGPSLTLVETSKGYKFGGYTPFSFKSKEGYSPDNDNETFIFSLNLMKKFNKLKEESLVYFAPNFGPCFGHGGSDFYIYTNLNFGKTINKSFLINSELTNGEQGDYNVNELEIYKVII